MKMITQETTCKCKDLTCEQLEMALSYLMSQFALNPCDRLADTVLHHLEMLVESIDPCLSNAKRRHYAQLYNRWWLSVSKDKGAKRMSPLMTSIDDSMVRH